MPTFYEILGCEKTATYEELKKCYHNQAKRYHPDKSNESQKEFLLLDKAWKTLRDPDLRREYDLTLAKSELAELPVYCELELEEMNFRSETEVYTYDCRCGGIYLLNRTEINGNEKIIVSCDDCTFNIIVKVGT